MPEYNPYQLSIVPRTSVEDQFASMFTEQFNTSLITSARELAPGGILPSSEVALDYRKDLGLRDREILQEYEKSLVQKGVPIAPAAIPTWIKVAIALLIASRLA